MVFAYCTALTTATIAVVAAAPSRAPSIATSRQAHRGCRFRKSLRRRRRDLRYCRCRSQSRLYRCRPFRWGAPLLHLAGRGRGSFRTERFLLEPPSSPHPPHGAHFCLVDKESAMRGGTELVVLGLNHRSTCGISSTSPKRASLETVFGRCLRSYKFIFGSTPDLRADGFVPPFILPSHFLIYNTLQHAGGGGGEGGEEATKDSYRVKLFIVTVKTLLCTCRCRVGKEAAMSGGTKGATRKPYAGLNQRLTFGTERTSRNTTLREILFFYTSIFGPIPALQIARFVSQLITVSFPPIQ